MRVLFLASLCVACTWGAAPLDTDLQVVEPDPIAGSCPRWSEWTCEDVNGGCHAWCAGDEIDVLCYRDECHAAFRGSGSYVRCDLPVGVEDTCAEGCRFAVESACVDELFE